MPRDLISKKTRTELREYLVGWTLREIRDEFEIGGLEPDLTYEPDVPGQRRGLVEQYYAAIDFTEPNAVDSLLQVYEAILVTAQGVRVICLPSVLQSLEPAFKRDYGAAPV